MKMLTPSRVAVCTASLMLVAAALGAGESKSDSKWENVKTSTGTIKTTTVEGAGGGGRNVNRGGGNGKYQNNSNYRVVPIYVEFDTDVAGLRIKYEAKGTGERMDLRIELEKEITKPNGDKDWQRVGLVGRPRADGTGGKAFTTGAGKYRMELTGQNVQYTINVEQPVKK